GLLEHAVDEHVELGQRVDGIVVDRLLERLPRALPLVPVEPWFVHGFRPARPEPASNPPEAQPPAEASNTIARVKVLVVGSGGREHALAWALSRSPLLTELHAAPGNPGIAALASCHPVRADDAASVVALAHELRIDLVVVGPEAPLVAGLAADLRHAGVRVFGPSAAAAQIEGSKAFSQDVLDLADVP